MGAEENEPSLTDEPLDEEALIKKNARRATSKDMEGKDFLDVSLEHHFQFKEQYPWEVAVYEVLDLIGGSSAVGNLGMRTLGFLALNPAYQEIIAREAHYARQKTRESEELRDIDHNESHESISLDHRSFMPFTEACLMETLRLASSPIIPHVANRDSTIQGMHVEKGTMVLFNTYILNMSENYWKNPKDFNPRRFLVRRDKDDHEEDFDVGGEEDPRQKGTSLNNNDSSEEETDKSKARVTRILNNSETNIIPGEWKLLKPEHFLPFSCGRRACLGYKMVMTTAFVVLANTCASFTLSPEDDEAAEDIKHQLRINGNIALPLHEKGCFRLKLHKRE
jgi:cytochrome P450 family 307 subfamily A